MEIPRLREECMVSSLATAGDPTPAYICPFDQAYSYPEQAARELKMDQSLLAVLASPRKAVTVSVPVKLDSGVVQVLAGHRVQHCDVLGSLQGVGSVTTRL